MLLTVLGTLWGGSEMYKSWMDGQTKIPYLPSPSLKCYINKTANNRGRQKEAKPEPGKGLSFPQNLEHLQIIKAITLPTLIAWR